MYKKFGLSLLVLVLVLVGSFSPPVFKTKAAADITITSAKITAPNEVTIIFNTGGDNLGTAPITAYGIANDGVASLTLASGGPARNLSGVVITPTTFTAVYTFTGAPATTNDTGSLAVHAPDAILDTNTTPDSLDHSIVSIPLTDGQAPTLAASDIFVNNSVQPNKVILTFSKPLASGPAQTVGNYMVTNGTITYTIASAVLNPSNVVTLTLATVNPADNKTFITNDNFRITQIRVTPNADITDTATPANPYAGGLVTANVNGTYDGTPATVNAPLVRTNATTYKVTFSEKLDLTTSQTLNKYTLGGTCSASTGNPSVAVLQTNGVDVVLTIPDTSGCYGGQTVIVTPANTITDVAGWPITSSAATKILATTAIITVSSAKITGPNQITVGFNPGAGTMSAAPITAFGAGALALTAGGARSIDSLVSLSGNTAVYTFDGAAVALNETAVLTFTTPTDITDTGGNTLNGVSYPSITISDGQAPVVTSVVITAGAYKIGSVIPVTITTSADADTYTAGAITINGHTMGSFASAGSYIYTGTYTVVSGDVDRASVGAIPISVVFTDTSNFHNSNVAYTAAPTSGGTVVIDANAPTTVTTTVSQSLITIANDAATFSVILTFSEPMDTGVYPTISFSENVLSSGLLTFITPDLGSWSNLNKTFTQQYTIDGSVSEDFAGVDVTVSGGRDVADNLMSATITNDLFDVDTQVLPSPHRTSSSGSTPRAINSLAFAGECKLGDLFSVITGKLCPVSSVPFITFSPIQTSCSIYGSTQELVKEKTRGINAKGVQNAINQLKATTLLLATDGIIGPLSETGIKNAQKILLINSDGIWGPKTQQTYVLFIKKQCPAV